jgi:hypothetical protein
LYDQANEGAKGLVSLCGVLAFGRADQSREQQIAAGIEYFTELRKHRQQIKQAIEELKRANSTK